LATPWQRQIRKADPQREARIASDCAMGRRPPVAAIAPGLAVASIVAFLLVGPYKAKEKQALKPGATSLVDQGCVVVPVASVPRRAHHSVFDGLGPVDAPRPNATL